MMESSQGQDNMTARLMGNGTNVNDKDENSSSSSSNNKSYGNHDNHDNHDNQGIDTTDQDTVEATPKKWLRAAIAGTIGDIIFSDDSESSSTTPGICQRNNGVQGDSEPVTSTVSIPTHEIRCHDENTNGQVEQDRAVDENNEEDNGGRTTNNSSSGTTVTTTDETKQNRCFRKPRLSLIWRSESLDYEHLEDGRVPLLPSSDSSASSGVGIRLLPSTVKSIGWLGSIAIAVNALASPAILQLPATYQQSGFVPTTIALVLIGILSTFCSLHMAQVVSKVPHNQSFNRMVEYSEPFRVFWGRRAFCFTQAVFFLCSVCLNCAGIVDVAQVVDTFLGHATGSVGVRFHPGPIHTVAWHHGPCTRDLVRIGGCDPFSDDTGLYIPDFNNSSSIGMLTGDDDIGGGDGDVLYGDLTLTVGYGIAAAVLVPVCLMDLKENVGWQIFGFLVLCVNSVQFVASFIWYGLDTTNLPLFGHGFDRMIGVILFNFSLVVAVPAWLHEKRPDVDVHTVVYTASFLATVLYILVGTFGALAIPNVNSNVLEPMVSGAFGPLMRISASFFAFVNIGLDIPLFSVLARYNLVNSGLFSRRFANILVVYVPWAVSWMFYQGDAIGELLSWGGVLFTSMVAFILPLCLALYLEVKGNAGRQQSHRDHDTASYNQHQQGDRDFAATMDQSNESQVGRASRNPPNGTGIHDGDITDTNVYNNDHNQEFATTDDDDDPNEGFEVYGKCLSSSRRGQIVLLSFLLTSGCAAVVFALIGLF